MNLDLQIIPYENWMKEDVIEMFNIQYDFSDNEFADTFEKFYEHDFQKDRCIRIVALDNKKVIGFQSFFYWPYKYKSKVYNSYQSGNSIVHENYRGKGIFGKLLRYTDENKNNLGIDFLIGFPVEKSYNSFIKKGWLNSFNLTWSIKALSPLSIISSFNKTKLEKQLNNKALHFTCDSNYVCLENSEEFQIYRSKYSKGIYLNHLYAKNDEQVHFSLKVNTRKKVIKELIIGNVHFTNFSDVLITEALNDLIGKVKKSKQITLISFAYPNNSMVYSQALKNNGFKVHDKSIYFICDDIPSEINAEIEKGAFLTYRGDIDTW
jgi:GNAT superfamily N-acetyltransferase